MRAWRRMLANAAALALTPGACATSVVIKADDPAFVRAQRRRKKTTTYEDAMSGVVEWNERAEAAFDDAHPDAP